MSNDAIGQRQPVHVRQSHRAMREARFGEARPGQGQHRLGGVHAQRLTHPRREQFQHAAGAGADIQQAACASAGTSDSSASSTAWAGRSRARISSQSAPLLRKTLGGDAGAFGQDAGGLAAVRFQDRVVWRAGGRSGRGRARLRPRSAARTRHSRPPARGRAGRNRTAASGGGTGAAATGRGFR